MKRGLLLLVLSLLIISEVYALSVTLNAPNDGNSTNVTTIEFNCSVTETQFSMSSIKLYTNTSGSWAQTGSTASGNITSASFTVSSITAGNYVWNCLAENSNANTAWAASNYSFTVSTLSFSSTIPNQTITEDTTSANAFDLDTYFTGATFYTVSGNTSINLSIDSGNQVSITGNANFTGTQNVTFTGRFGSSSITSNIVLINITNVNDPPYIIANISNQSTGKNENFTVDMTDYFAEHDPNANITYTLTATDLSASQNGTDLKIIPDTNFEGAETVYITASDGSYSARSNTFTITVGSENTAPTIDSFSPDSNPTLSINDTQDFTISASDEDNDTLTISWEVNNEDQENSGTTLTFTAVEDGIFTIEVFVSDGTEEASKSWTVTVGAALLEEPEVASILVASETAAVCGNGIAEAGEDCSTCALDVACAEGFICKQGTCEAKTGAGRAIAILALSTLGIIIIAILIYYFTTLKKKGQPQQTTFKYTPASEAAPPSSYTDFYQSKK